MLSWHFSADLNVCLGSLSSIILPKDIDDGSGRVTPKSPIGVQLGCDLQTVKAIAYDLHFHPQKTIQWVLIPSGLGRGHHDGRHQETMFHNRIQLISQKNFFLLIRNWFIHSVSTCINTDMYISFDMRTKPWNLCKIIFDCTKVFINEVPGNSKCHLSLQ